MKNPQAPSRQRWAVILSSMVHLCILLIAGVPSSGSDNGGANAAAEQPPLRQDNPTLIGDTFDIDLVGPQGGGWELALPQPDAAAASPTETLKPKATPHPDEAMDLPNAKAAVAPKADLPGPTPAPPKTKKKRKRRKRRRRTRKRKPLSTTATPAPPVTSAAPSTSGAASTSGAPLASAPLAKTAGPNPSGPSAGQGKPGKATGEGKTYGQDGPPRRGFRYLSAAFVRALPAAVSADKKWSSLPLGRVTEGNVTFKIDADGRITDTVVEPKNALISRMLRRTMPLLNAGEFMLHTDPKAAGSEVYRLTIHIEQRDPPKAGGKSADIQLGQVRPSSGRPGKAYFTLKTGRYVEIEVAISASRAHASP